MNINLISVALPAAQSFYQGGKQYGSCSSHGSSNTKVMALIVGDWIAPVACNS